MTVAELISILVTADQDKEILIRDTAAGFRPIKDVEDCINLYYAINSKKK